MTARNLLSGQLFCSSASVAQPGTSVAANPGFFIVALTTNVGNIYIGNDGTGALSTATGYQMLAGTVIYLGKPVIQNLSELLLLSTSTTDGIAWLVG